jgi:hypothetical protein
MFSAEVGEVVLVTDWRTYFEFQSVDLIRNRR